MSSQSVEFHRICSIDRDLLFFNADEQQQHLGLLTLKEHRQLQSMIRTIHEHIQKITNLQRTVSTHSSITSTLAAETNGSAPPPIPPPPPPPQEQTAAIHDFFRKKQTRHLYARLNVIKERYSVAMQEQQIQQLYSDMERYQQLQVIQSLSGRLDVSSQLYDELQHLRHSLTSLRREWKLDRIHSIVSSLAIPSPSSPISSELLVPPPPSSSSLSSTIQSLSENHGHRWYPSLDRKKWDISISSSSSSTTSFARQSSKHGLFGTIKNWFRTNRIKKTSETTTISTVNNSPTTTTTTTTADTSIHHPSSSSSPSPLSLPKKKHRHHQYHFGQRSQPHQHLFHYSSQQECRNKIQQLIHHFNRVFETNARQNQQRMHQLYSRVFQQGVDPMLAEDIQRLCLTVSTAPPPTLLSLMQPGLSSALGSFCVTSDSMRDSFLITDDDALNDMIFLMVTPPSSSENPQSTLSSSSTTREKNRNWVKTVWEKSRGGGGNGITTSTKQRHQQHKQKQKQPSSSSSSTLLHLMQQHDETTGSMQQHQGWSICLGLVSEHLVHVGQHYYTQWIHQVIQAQHQQTMPFQIATETLASMYRALQIEQGHAILTRLCTQLESGLS